MGQSREVIASGERTATGSSSTISLDRRAGRQLSLLVDISAVGVDVDETLDLALEWSHNGITFAPAETVDTFTQLTQVGGVQAVVKAFDVKAPRYRLAWTLGGTTPSFTFSISEHVG